MFSLATLLQNPAAPTTPISYLTDDSREAKEGSVFVWDSRIGGDGTTYLQQAKAKGAITISDLKTADYTVENAGEILSRYAQSTWPGQPEICVGVTGTSGKTSTAWFAQQVATAAGIKASSEGTLGTVIGNEIKAYSGYTSPSALKLHPILQSLKKQGVGLTALEVSSHALALNRMDSVTFKAAGITNVTQDHLDYHHTWAEYFAAKQRLFTEVLPEGGTAVINTNRQELWPLASMVKQTGKPLLSVGTSGAELTVEVVEAGSRGLTVNLKYTNTPVPLFLPLIGSFQAENVAVALGLLVGAGLPWEKIATGAASLSGVPGRMEIIPGKEHQPVVVVDYAHKPDALERALSALRPQTKGKLWVVFGCGGNRDTTKRPIMGEIAKRLADVTIITDDNPRKEAPAPIRKAIAEGAGGEGPTVRIIGDRHAAIEEAIRKASPEDVILVAGKGHEPGQIVCDITHPFDDREVVKSLLA